MPFLGVVVVVAVWWAATAAIGPNHFLARFAPVRVAAALTDLVLSVEIWRHLAASLRRVVSGLGVSFLLGFPLGLALGFSRHLARAAGPPFQFARMVSPLAWTPLAIIVFGVGDAPVYFLIVMGCTWPIVLNTVAGVHALDPRLVMMAKALGGTRLEIARTVLWPSIREHVLTGARLAIGLAWIILVPAEMLGVDSGIGYFILDTRDRLAYGELGAALLIVGGCGFTIDSCARWALRTRKPGSRRARAEARRHAESAAERSTQAARGDLLGVREG
ncbi:MAG: ABC transporter permease [Chloroflexota bacterium]|nr:MAG: ABC transporter permease [Chloroflexota bacterium]